MKYVLALLVLLVLYGAYFLLCYLGTGTTKKNMSSTNYSAYPDALQEKIRADESLKDMVPASKSPLASVLSNLVLFTVVFVLVGLIVRPESFWVALVYFLILGEGLNLFDLLVIDRCWWRHSSRVRIAGIGTADEYWDPQKHLASFKRAIGMFALAAVLAALIMQLF